MRQQKKYFLKSVIWAILKMLLQIVSLNYVYKVSSFQCDCNKTINVSCCHVYGFSRSLSNNKNRQETRIDNRPCS